MHWHWPELLLKGMKDWAFVKISPARIDSKSWIGLNAIILIRTHLCAGLATFGIAESIVIGDYVMTVRGATFFDHGSHPVNFS